MIKIDKDLLFILSSNCDKKAYRANIVFLINSGVLTKIEMDICNSVCRNLDAYNVTHLENVLLLKHIDFSDLEHLTMISYSEMYEKINQLIEKRYKEEYQKIISESEDSLNKAIYDEKALSLFFKRYAEKIDINESSVFENLEQDPAMQENKKGISSGNQFIDDVSGGILYSDVTTIIGSTATERTLWAINIAYKALKEKKNVLYISLDFNEAEIYKRLFSRHSCDRKFNQKINPDYLYNDYDKEVYTQVYMDFKNFFFNHLFLYDKEKISINSLYSLQKLIVYAENKCLDKNDCGIDLIIIDGFSNIRLEINNKTINNSARIINEYYKYLKNQANNFLCTNKEIPIVVTSPPDKGSAIYLINNCEYLLDYVSNEMVNLSDSVFTIKWDEYSRKSNKVYLKILKSPLKIMEEAKICPADIAYCHLKYSEDNNDDEVSKDECIAYLKEENQILANTSLNSVEESMHQFPTPTKLSDQELDSFFDDIDKL